MDFQLSPAQCDQQQAFRAFVDEQLMPYAEAWDQAEGIPAKTIRHIADAGYMATIIPTEYGGRPIDLITHGLLVEEFGRSGGSSVGLLTVQGMVARAILKWGNSAQRDRWLRKLATGEIIGSLALSEPNVGSDAKHVETTATADGTTFVINGRKKWTSFGQIAGLFLVIAQCEGKSAAFLVERATPGLRIDPIKNLLGFRAAQLAELHFDAVRIPVENLLGRIGLGFSHIVGTCLDHGRYCIAWGAVGLGQGCLNACLRYTSKRKQFGVLLREHQLIQELLADMIVNVKAARLLCLQSGFLRDVGDPDSIVETNIAKYFASQMAAQVATDAVQIHGANGCVPDYPVARYFRDAKIMEIVEGSSQMQQLLIARFGS